MKNIKLLLLCFMSSTVFAKAGARFLPSLIETSVMSATLSKDIKVYNDFILNCANSGIWVDADRKGIQPILYDALNIYHRIITTEIELEKASIQNIPLDNDFNYTSKNKSFYDSVKEVQNKAEIFYWKYLFNCKTGNYQKCKEAIVEFNSYISSIK